MISIKTVLLVEPRVCAHAGEYMQYNSNHPEVRQHEVTLSETPVPGAPMDLPSITFYLCSQGLTDLFAGILSYVKDCQRQGGGSVTLFNLPGAPYFVASKIDQFVHDNPGEESGPAHIILGDYNIKDPHIDYVLAEIDIEPGSVLKAGNYEHTVETLAPLKAFLTQLRSIPEWQRLQSLWAERPYMKEHPVYALVKEPAPSPARKSKSANRQNGHGGHGGHGGDPLA